MCKRLLATALALAMSAGSAIAQDVWGCGWSASNTNGTAGRIWNAGSRKEAVEASLRQCRAYNYARCYIISCSKNVASKQDADKLWPMKGEPGGKCGTEGWPDC